MREMAKSVEINIWRLYPRVLEGKDHSKTLSYNNETIFLKNLKTFSIANIYVIITYNHIRFNRKQQKFNVVNKQIACEMSIRLVYKKLNL